MRRLPQKLYDRAELLSRSHPLVTVAMILKLRPSALTVMRRRGWKALDKDPRCRPIPMDWAIYARKMTHAQLCAHYRAGTVTVSRWIAEKPVRQRMYSPGRPRKST